MNPISVAIDLSLTRLFLVSGNMLLKMNRRALRSSKLITRFQDLDVETNVIRLLQDIRVFKSLI